MRLVPIEVWQDRQLLAKLLMSRFMSSQSLPSPSWKLDHSKLRINPARNFQPLGLIEVGTVCILFDHSTSLLLQVRVELEQICVHYD